MPVIELKKLTKFFGAVPAVLEASLTVEEGDFFGFVGPNGSGKSTTIRMMMNYVRPTSGTATILGMDSRSQSGKLKKMVGYVPSEVDYYMDMRAMEVIRYAAAMRGLQDKSRICLLYTSANSHPANTGRLPIRRPVSEAQFHSLPAQIPPGRKSPYIQSKR